MNSITLTRYRVTFLEGVKRVSTVELTATSEAGALNLAQVQTGLDLPSIIEKLS